MTNLEFGREILQAFGVDITNVTGATISIKPHQPIIISVDILIHADDFDGLANLVKINQNFQLVERK